MKQKLMIACGFIHAPEVMIFDEPLTGLDPLGIRRMKESVTRRAQQGAATPARVARSNDFVDRHSGHTAGVSPAVFSA